MNNRFNRKVISLTTVVAMLLLVMGGFMALNPAAPVKAATLMASEPFSSATGALHNTNTGTGWSAAWVEQNSSTAVPGYNVANTSALSYSNLSKSGNYAIGGYAYESAGRPLDIGASGPFASYLSGGLIGLSGKTLYVSAMLRKDANNQDENSLYLHANNTAWYGNYAPVLAMGYFGANSETSGTKYWTLKIGSSTYIKSNVAVTVGSTALLVMKIVFGSTNTISLFVNPSSLGGAEPGSANASGTTTTSCAFKSVTYLGGNGTNQSSIDEIRFGDTFGIVTPTSGGSTATPTPANTATPTPASTATPTPRPATSTPTPTPGSGNINVSITRATKYQTMEGFGFFGSKDVWWNSTDPNHFYDDAWLTKIIDDLGLSIIRDEVYPNNPVTSTTSTDPQDANWNKQKPFVQALKAKADAYRVPLKYINTIWSPPGEWKINCSMSWAGDTAATRGGAHNSTKNGGTLDTAQYTNYANWMKAGIQMYADAGVNVYAVSLQNEPAFVETYNSCVYTTNWYCDLLTNVVPTIKTTYPNVKIYGSEDMLSLEGAVENYQYFYHMTIKNNATALSKLDKWAVHGYTDGVSAINATNSADYWNRHRTTFQEPSGKDGWMTETSGFNENWADDASSDAFDLGISIQCALAYGHASAWVWWQGSDMGGIGDYSMMSGTTTGKKYAVSKQFYRFIRPNSKMVDLSVGDSNIIGTAFENTTLNNFVVVLVNMATTSKTVNLSGTSVPTSYTMYRTTSTDNCVNAGAVTNNNITLPAKSVITLVNGNYKE